MSCFSFFSNSKSNVNPFLDPPFSSPTSTYIPSKVNEKVSITESTGEKLTLLRSELKRLQLDCYLIPTSDSHASEYVGDSDKRRSWISGFNGSAGIAIVCLNKAVMFVDSRYYTQAEQQLDSNWTINKVGLKGVLNYDEWLKTMPKGSKIGLDPSLHSLPLVQSLIKALEPLEISIEFPEKNLVDLIWTDRPERKAEAVNDHPLRFTGESSKSKLDKLVSFLYSYNTKSEQEQGIVAPSFLITTLPQIAYILNLRGSDIEFNPLFYSYLLVSPIAGVKNVKIQLFIQDNVLEDDVRRRLESDGVSILPYEAIDSVLEDGRAQEVKVLAGNSISFKLGLCIGLDNIKTIQSPIELSQSMKNSTEIQGFRNAYLRDGLAWVKWAAWLDELMKSGKEEINEWDAAVELTRIREGGEFYMGLSYDNISATNENAALPHYAPTATSSRIIDTTTPYLNDSGAQYLDGTIDNTRTAHFGTPTRIQKIAFTKVLQGHIGIDSMIFPSGTTGFQLDLIARKELWKGGMNYSHGTGHGIGEYLCVHEGSAIGQGIGSSTIYNSMPLQIGQITSNEPGYYKPGSFGIRIESVVVVKPVFPEFREEGDEYLGFERLSVVPIQTSLTDSKLLTSFEKKWLKEHNKRCLDLLSPYLRGDKRTMKWLKRQ